MHEKNLLFLGGLGAPAGIFFPWFKAFRRLGYKVRRVPNSFMSTDTVSCFAETLVEEASRFATFDVVGVSYGGNAALYAAYLSPEVCRKTGKMVTVCAPLLGGPQLPAALMRMLPGFLAGPLGEMGSQSEIIGGIRDVGMRGSLPFELHCIYHERDLVAPPATATLPRVGRSHALDFPWKCVPRILMHQAACVNPRTLRTLVRVLDRP